MRRGERANLGRGRARRRAPRPWLFVLALSAGLSLLDGPPSAHAGDAPTDAVDIEEHLGRSLPRDLTFTDHEGRRVTLGDTLGPARPTVLVLAYYHCPMLCGLVLRAVVDAMNEVRFTLGVEYDALTVSVDPRDTPKSARAKRTSTLGALRAGEGWPFLVGDADAVARLADAAGFRYAYDPRTDQFAHPAAALVVTPDGRISRYLYGVSYPARDLRLALLEAGAGKIGGILDRVIMTCYRYDPAARAYGPYVLGFVRLIGAFSLLAVLVTLGLYHWKERRPR